MKQHWNIESAQVEGMLMSKQPIYGTKEQAQAFIECMYDTNNVKLVPLNTIDLDELQAEVNGVIVKVHHNMCYLFTYQLGPNNHNQIKDEEDNTFFSYVEKDYFELLKLK